VESVVGPVRPQMAVLRMRIACWIPEDKNTRLEFVILIAFPLNSGCTKAPQRYVIHTLSNNIYKILHTLKMWLFGRREEIGREADRQANR